MNPKTSDHVKEAEKFDIKGLTILTPYDVYCLVVSAFEGGSTYWAALDDKNKAEFKKATSDMQDEPLVDRMLMAIKRGVKVVILDQEDDDKPYTIDASSFAKAETLMLQKYRRHLGDVLREEDDAITGDVFFQLMVLGDCIYG